VASADLRLAVPTREDFEDDEGNEHNVTARKRQVRTAQKSEIDDDDLGGSREEGSSATGAAAEPPKGKGPQDLISEGPSNYLISFWSGREDSNLRPLGPELD
jgi:hypothetical protein